VKKDLCFSFIKDNEEQLYIFNILDIYYHQLSFYPKPYDSYIYKNIKYLLFREDGIFNIRLHTFSSNITDNLIQLNDINTINYYKLDNNQYLQINKYNYDSLYNKYFPEPNKKYINYKYFSNYIFNDYIIQIFDVKFLLKNDNIYLSIKLLNDMLKYNYSPLSILYQIMILNLKELLNF